MKKPRGTLAERFWPKVNKRGPDECWPWKASKRRGGYGQIGAGGRGQGALGAPKAALLLIGVTVPDGACVLHNCDNPICVNPRHLRIGTRATNALDRLIRGRTPRKEKHWNSKLTAQDVEAIRTDIRTQKVIAAEYGISQSQVSHVKTGARWREEF